VVGVAGEAAGRTTATPAVVTAAPVAGHPAALAMREAAGRTMRLLLVPPPAVVADRPAVLRVYVEEAGGSKKSTDRAPKAEAVAHRLSALLTDASAATGKTRGATPQVATAVAVGGRRVVLTTAASADALTTLWGPQMATAGAVSGRHVVLKVNVATSPGRKLAGRWQLQCRPAAAAPLSRTRHLLTAPVVVMAAAAPPRAFVNGMKFPVRKTGRPLSNGCGCT